MVRLELRQEPCTGTPGDIASPAGDLWLTPTTRLRVGRAAIWPAQADAAAVYGWRALSNLPDGRVLLERAPRSAIMALSRWQRSRTLS